MTLHQFSRFLSSGRFLLQAVGAGRSALAALPSPPLPLSLAAPFAPHLRCGGRGTSALVGSTEPCLVFSFLPTAEWEQDQEGCSEGLSFTDRHHSCTQRPGKRGTDGAAWPCAPPAHLYKSPAHLCLCLPTKQRCQDQRYPVGDAGFCIRRGPGVGSAPVGGMSPLPSPSGPSRGCFVPPCIAASLVGKAAGHQSCQEPLICLPTALSSRCAE